MGSFFLSSFMEEYGNLEIFEEKHLIVWRILDPRGYALDGTCLDLD